MNKAIGLLFIISGLVFVGLGMFDGFEKFDEYLSNNDHKRSYYDGLYLTQGDSIAVTSLSDNDLKVLINNETYEFVYNGEYYENKYSGFKIDFFNDELVLYKDGEKIRTLQKEKK